LTREKVINHILNVLDYDNSLCQFVKSYADFSIGKLCSVIPTNVEIENIVEFSWGFGKGSDNLLPGRILKTLKSNTGTFAVNNWGQNNWRITGVRVNLNSAILRLLSSTL